MTPIPKPIHGSMIRTFACPVMGCETTVETRDSDRPPASWKRFVVLDNIDTLIGFTDYFCPKCSKDHGVGQQEEALRILEANEEGQ